MKYQLQIEIGEREPKYEISSPQLPGRSYTAGGGWRNLGRGVLKMIEKIERAANEAAKQPQTD